ncbi:TfdA family Taurine catabolism dioxygenase TauD [Seiridium cupressi]
MYDLDPSLVTPLLAVSVPAGRRQTCRYDDGSGAELDVPLGTTAFFSGYPPIWHAIWRAEGENPGHREVGRDCLSDPHPAHPLGQRRGSRGLAGGAGAGLQAAKACNRSAADLPARLEEDDLALFNNHGVMHYIVGFFEDGETRKFRQCNMAASRPSQGPDNHDLQP